MLKKLLLISALLIITGQSVKAATIQFTPTDDMYHYDGAFVLDYNYGYLHATADYGRSFIKYNLEKDKNGNSVDLSKANIKSATLKLFLYYSTNKNTTTAYLYNYNNWTEPPKNGYKYTSPRELNGSIVIGKNATTGYFNNMNNPMEFDILLSTDIFSGDLLSIGLEDTTFSGKDKVEYFASNEFASKEYFTSAHPEGYYAPVLEIETDDTAPVPEPSSMILGFIGLAGVFSKLKNKNKFLVK